MNDQNNDMLGLIGLSIAVIALGALLVKAAISFFNSLGALMTSIATSFVGFAKLLISVGIVAVAVAIVGGILYAGFYCIIKYIRTVRKITAFREEFLQNESSLRKYVNSEVSEAKTQVKKLTKEMNALIDELTKPPKQAEIPIKPDGSFTGLNPEIVNSNQDSINSDPIKEEIMITNNY